MKKLIILIGLGLLPILALASDQEEVFPTKDAIWNIQVNENRQDEYRYGLIGDTIIDGKLYNKLYLLNDTTLFIDSEDIYYGGFRQEGKQVWFRPNLPEDYNPGYDDYNYPKESLIYDFSKEAGDTIWHNFFSELMDIYYWTMRDSVTASIITSIEINEEGDKIYNTDHYIINYHDLFIPIGRSDKWREGIGSVSHGLFWFLHSEFYDGKPRFQLTCLKQNDEIRYLNNPYCKSCFCDPSDLPEINRIPIEVTLKDNQIKVEGDPLAFPCDLKLYSLMGELILEKTIKTSGETVPVNSLKGIGIYQIQKDKETIKIGKLIIN